MKILKRAMIALTLSAMLLACKKQKRVTANPFEKLWAADSKPPILIYI